MNKSRRFVLDIKRRERGIIHLYVKDSSGKKKLFPSTVDPRPGARHHAHLYRKLDALLKAEGL
jgi:hypothetical protein